MTVSRGEPPAQAEACAEPGTWLNTVGRLIVAYTGKTLEKLARLADAAIQQVMALADLIVDGPYVPASHERGLAYRGSSSQRVIDLGVMRSGGELRLLQVD